MSIDISSAATSLTVVPTVTASAYSAGMVVGGVVTLSGAVRNLGWGALLQAVTATFASGVQPSLDCFVLSSALTTSTATDHVALAITAADLAKIEGVIHMTDAVSCGSTSIVQAQQQAMPFDSTSQNAFAIIVTRSAVTLGSTTDMTLTFQLLQN